MMTEKDTILCLISIAKETQMRKINLDLIQLKFVQADVEKCRFWRRIFHYL